MEKANSTGITLPKIDVIIPAYNAHDTLMRCLSSIAMQTIVSDIVVTIVDDHSSKNYDNIVSCFKDYLKLNVLTLSTNKGPGYARQYGREHTDNPLITFIDADDTFNSSIALQTLRLALISDPKSHCCFGTFMEEQILPKDKVINGQKVPKGTLFYEPHQMDSVWVFGKLYSRQFLDHYEIKMNGTRSNEDTGFNMLIKLCSNQNEQIKFINDVVYIWHATTNSITRINDCDYSFNASFDGYTDNMIWAITEALKRNPMSENAWKLAVEVLGNLYFYYIETIGKKPEYTEKNLNACKRYYNAVYKKVEPLVNDKIFEANYNVAARNFYGMRRNEGFVPKIDIWRFLELIKEPITDNVANADNVAIVKPIAEHKPITDNKKTEKPIKG